MGIGLPVIVDIAISLVFTYFTLSLFASEIKNFFKDLLQWRAVHLKESIEGLLVGNDKTQTSEARTLANHLYATPLIRSLTHQTKGGVADAVRMPLRSVGKWVSNSENRIFGDQDGGPSEIPAATFSGSLVSTFDFVTIYRQLVAYRLEVAIQSMVPNSEDYDQRLAEDVTGILASFKAKSISFTKTIENLATEVQDDSDILDADVFERYFGSPEAIARFSDKMQISLADVIRAVRQYLTLKKDILDTLTHELGENPTFEDAKQALIRLRDQYPDLTDKLPPSTDQTFLALALILTSPVVQELIAKLPPIPDVLGKNLERLADTALAKIEDRAQEAIQFEQEISNWFDESMVRAQGVYDRNAKLIILGIAFAIAVIANADTFYMIDHFAKEKMLTESVIQVVDQLPQDVLEQPDRINELSAQLSLPMGWQKSVVTQQKQFHLIPFSFIPFWLQRLPGWIVTGIAVSMGASFWYNLLKKLVNVRKTGEIPRSPETAGATTSAQPSN